jgi:ribosomal protein S27AE
MSQNKLFLAIDNTKPAEPAAPKMFCPDCYGGAFEIFHNARARCLGFKCGHETDLKALFRRTKNGG